jgi:hypothetical protein
MRRQQADGPADRKRKLAGTVGYPAAREIVGGEFEGDFVAGIHSDAEFAHLAGNVGQDFVSVVQDHPEHCIGQGLFHGAFYGYAFFFGHLLSCFEF